MHSIGQYVPNKIQQWLLQVAVIVILASVLISLIAPSDYGVQAQEVTEEPSQLSSPTPTATIIPTITPLLTADLA